MSFQWIDIDKVEELKPFYLSILPKIRAAARELGYAVGVHGSLYRDLDLIAVPWREDFAEIDKLAEVIQMAACGLRQTKYGWETKPNGRVATCFPVCWVQWDNPRPGSGHIDLSVIGHKSTISSSSST